MIREIKKNPEIVAISNKYKNIFDDLINSLDAESPDWLGPIDKKSCNIPRFKDSLTEYLKGDC